MNRYILYELHNVLLLHPFEHSGEKSAFRFKYLHFCFQHRLYRTNHCIVSYLSDRIYEIREYSITMAIARTKEKMLNEYRTMLCECL